MNSGNFAYFERLGREMSIDPNEEEMPTNLEAGTEEFEEDRSEISVVCLECSHSFVTAYNDDECPMCGGSDLDLA